MARGTNPNRCRARRALTSEPAALARRGIPHRGELLEVPTGQQILQAALFEIFAHPTREHPWNPSGRHLTELFDCYGSWISPQPDRIVIGSTLAVRMASYLLPYVSYEGWTPACRGIPGMRFLRALRHGYELHHLPTGTALEIRDAHRGRVSDLTFEARTNRAEDGFEAVWRRGELTDVERQWGDIWRFTSHTGLYSAWFNALRLFDSAVDRELARHPVLHPAPAEPARARLSWCGTLTPESAVAYLQELGIGAYGEPLVITTSVDGFAIVGAGGVSMELHQRSACAKCHKTYRKWHGDMSVPGRRRTLSSGRRPLPMPVIQEVAEQPVG